MKNHRMFFAPGTALLFFLFCLPAHAISIESTIVAKTLADHIVGPGINIVGTPTYKGIADQSGTFKEGNNSGIGFDEGIVLTSGDVKQIDGSNHPAVETKAEGTNSSADDINTGLGEPGDPDLTSLAGTATYDAAVLEFEFQFGDGTVGGDVYFNFVFASEEYLNYIGSQYNDVFGFFLDNVNVGLIPGTDTPITVNNVNDSINSTYYRNNVNNTDGIPVAGLGNHFDGLTTVITVQALGLSDGIHTMKFAVADANDPALDAGVFIQAGSFSIENPAVPANPVPEPGTLLLLITGFVGMGGLVRKKIRHNK